MIVNVFNKCHFSIIVKHQHDKFVFPAFKEININVGPMDYIFKLIRTNPNLRVGKVNNAEYITKNKIKVGQHYNFVYDIVSQHAGAAYRYAIEALASPIKKCLPKDETTYLIRPGPGPDGSGLNVRFFSSKRINQQAKVPVGPRDVFISHGIGDKDYWVGPNIKDFKYAFCTGPAWEERMRNTGYEGQIFQIGYTKLDPLFNKEEYKKLDYGKKCVRWLPTHGYNNKHQGRSSYPECLELIKQIPQEYDTKVGLHPTSKLHSRKKQNPTMQELVDADVVIADAGSTLYEAWALGKPVIFPDWICLKDILNHFDKDNLEYQIYYNQIGYHAKDMKDLLRLIPIAIEEGMKQPEIDFMEQVLPTKFRGQSGKFAAEALMKIRNSL